MPRVMTMATTKSCQRRAIPPLVSWRRRRPTNSEHADSWHARVRRRPASPSGCRSILAQRGLGSRRVIEEWIRAQRLTVNGRIAELGLKVTAHDDIRLDGRPIRARAAAAAQVFVFNRSPGDPLREADGTRAALIERLPKSAGKRFSAVSPMPGIDGGLELVTSDGGLATKLQRAMHQLACEFRVRVKGLLGPDQLAGVKSGKLDRPSRMVDRLAQHQRGGSRRLQPLVPGDGAQRQRQGHPPAVRAAGCAGQPRDARVAG